MRRAAFQNRIVIPDEDHYVQMDTTTGTAYLCVVFSRQPLPFATIPQRLEEMGGPFLSRLQTVLDATLVAEECLWYTETGGIGFTAASRGRIIVPIVVAIEHVH